MKYAPASLLTHFNAIEETLNHLFPILPTLPTRNPVSKRWFCFAEALFDWKIACSNYESDLKRYLELRPEFSRLAATSHTQGGEAQRNEIIEQYMQLVPRLRYDIRCYYVFAKIAFVTFAGLLFSMAGEKSQDWKQVQRFLKRIKRNDVPLLLRDFNDVLREQLRWFQAHVNLYRNDFIEHPHSSPLLPGLKFTEQGAHITGLTGAGLSVEDQKKLDRLAGSVVPEFSHMTDIDRYHWACQHLEDIPEDHIAEVEEMIRRVGLESGDLSQITTKMAGMFIAFLSFFEAWLHKHPLRQ